jgi:hypothetical protein
MKLDQLYENFGLASPERQQAMVAAYRLRRAEDMAKPSTYKKKKQSTAKPKLELTEQEKLVAKLLGLKPKDILALRSATSVEEDITDDNEVDLFKDSTYEGGDEE